MLPCRTFSLQTEKAYKRKHSQVYCASRQPALTEDRWTKVTAKNYKRPMDKDSFTKTDGHR